MSNISKFFIGLLTFFPVAHMLFFLGVMAYSFNDPSMMSEHFSTVFVSHFAAMFVTFGMMAFYMVHAITKNEALEEQTHRLLWALILFMGNMIAMPVYYLIYILPEGRSRQVV